ncbi:hypothetical protein KUV47_09190 [Vannielia litorea]|uniref:hypothetical protein n=1 Tax=Vannielia litorea TaxID=1217970 RepID=UPI001C94AEAC|nr:hypothetical protein [Vannielia litorea]MBY6153383.1 hypothetical protein [Vannielia litorea]
MTNAARKVLADCETALRLLEDETDLDVWRVHWVGALTLIRAVGHILHKVDGKDGGIREFAERSYQAWKAKDEHAIFRDFIERERNNILKEYGFGYDPAEAFGVVAEEGSIHFLDENIYRPITEGYGQGEDTRDVYREAIDWWRTQLDEIDRERGLSLG